MPTWRAPGREPSPKVPATPVAADIEDRIEYLEGEVRSLRSRIAALEAACQKK